MNIKNKGHNNIKSVVVDFQSYVSRKPGFKKRCKGCLYLFSPKNKNDCFCDQCGEGRKAYRNLKATQAMLAVWGIYGHH